MGLGFISWMGQVPQGGVTVQVARWWGLEVSNAVNSQPKWFWYRLRAQANLDPQDALLVFFQALGL